MGEHKNERTENSSDVDENRQRHRDLDAWKLAVRLAKHIYALTRYFPDEEKYGLVQQVRRAAVSIPSNVAEGAGRGSDAEYLRFLYMARGSLTELDTQVELSTALNYVPSKYEEGLKKLVVRVGETLSGLIGKVKRDVEASDG